MPRAHSVRAVPLKPSPLSPSSPHHSRVAEDAPHFARGLHPVYLLASVDAAQAAAEAWVAAQAGMGGPARVLSSAPGFFHARFVTWFWGFADDFFVSVRCAAHDTWAGCCSGRHALASRHWQLGQGMKRASAHVFSIHHPRPASPVSKPC